MICLRIEAAHYEANKQAQIFFFVENVIFIRTNMFAPDLYSEVNT